MADKIHARAAGRKAYQSGSSISACPYGPDNFFCRLSWAQGWMEAQAMTQRMDNIAGHAFRENQHCKVVQ